MNEKLIKELEIQVQDFKPLSTEYWRLESAAAQSRMMKVTADWVDRLLKDTGFETPQLPVDRPPAGIPLGKNVLGDDDASR